MRMATSVIEKMTGGAIDGPTSGFGGVNRWVLIRPPLWRSHRSFGENRIQTMFDGIPLMLRTMLPLGSPCQVSSSSSGTRTMISSFPGVPDAPAD
jgi:hypothetical protein